MWVISKSSQLWSSVVLGVICHLGNLKTLARGTTLSSAKLLKPAARDVLLGRPAHGVSAGDRGVERATAPHRFSLPSHITEVTSKVLGRTVGEGHSLFLGARTFVWFMHSGRAPHLRADGCWQ